MKGRTMWKLILVWFVIATTRNLSCANNISNQSDITYGDEINSTLEENYGAGYIGSGDYTYDTTDDTDDNDDYEEPIGTDDYFDEKAIEEDNEKAKSSVNASRLFSCDNNEVSFTIDKKCDGIRDCYDCSDEIGCSGSREEFFFCYGHARTEATPNITYTSSNPYCIPKMEFCDDTHDCANGLDEKQVGNGFKCEVKGRHRTCILPDDMICDDVIDCEDQSDSCDAEQGHVTGLASFSTGKDSKAFQCLDVNYNISIFQHQVCDGVIDCPDLSDECLCVEPASESLRHLCSNVCWPNVYSDSPRNAACSHCKFYQVRVCSDSFGENTNTQEDTVNFDPCTCVDLDDICASSPPRLSVLQQSVCITNKNQQIESVECLSLDGSFEVIRARMCDDRPECFLGEDECTAACRNTRANQTVADTAGHFCDYLVEDHGFVCETQDVGDTTLNNNIIPCDGIRDCVDGTDEKFCPARISCEDTNTNGSTVTNAASSSIQTYDRSQLCDGIADCNNNGDENPMICVIDRKKDCPHSALRFESCDRNTSQNDTQPNDLPSGRSFVGGSRTTLGNGNVTNMDLQYALLAFAATGSIGNLFGIIFALHNAIRLLRKQREPTFNHFVLYIRESVLFSTIGTAKALFSIYLVFILMYDSSGEIKCWKGGLWRSMESCSVLGGIAFASASSTWFALLIYATFEILSTFKSSKESSQENTVGFLSDNHKKKTTQNRCFLPVWILASFGFVVLIWLPMFVTVMWAGVTYDANALANLTGASNILPSGAISRDQAIKLSERAVAMSQMTPPSPERFSWAHMEDLMATFSPSLGFQLSGVMGYYSYTTACLPMLLSRPASSLDDGAAAGFSSSFMIFICCLCAYVLLISIVGFVRVQKSLKPSENRALASEAADCSVLCFTVAEAIAWIPIFVTYFLNLALPKTVSDYWYQAVVLLSLAINCGFVSVLLHFRKGRVTMVLCPIKKTPADHDDNREAAAMFNDVV